MFEQWLNGRLEDRRLKGLYRSLSPDNNLVDFTSNDYLGLARNELLTQYIKESLDGVRIRNGSTGSRLLSGNSSATEEVEHVLAGIFRSEAALLFSSGYAANLSVLSAIPQKDDTILYDELAHASIKDGARLSLAKKFSFRHNDLSDLEKKVIRSSGRVFVVVESLYSMDGDECPLSELVTLSRRHNFILVLDEAHTTGVRGDGGSGLAVEKGLQDMIPIRIYTFGKAMGVCGACVSGSANLVHYLVNFARPFIYTTAPSQYQIASIKSAFNYLKRNINLQQRLQEKINFYLSRSRHWKNLTASTSAIQTFLVPGNNEAREVATKLQASGFDVRAILSPTVPKGKERLRICLHTFNTDQEIDSLVNYLQSFPQE